MLYLVEVKFEERGSEPSASCECWITTSRAAAVSKAYDVASRHTPTERNDVGEYHNDDAGEGCSWAMDIRVVEVADPCIEPVCIMNFSRDDLGCPSYLR